MKLAAARPGGPLQVKGREIDFSFYPMTRTNRRWGVHSMLYAADPWAVISGSVSQSIRTQAERRASTSFVRQAREYFGAAERANSVETRPLLYYYSFLNLAKAIAMGRGRPGMVGKVSHGIAHVGGTGHLPSTAKLQIGASAAVSGGTKSAIDELHRALEGGPVATGQYSVGEIIPQSVVGHRMWREGLTPVRLERFVPIDGVDFMHDATSSQLWLRMYVHRASLRSRGRRLNEMLNQSGLSVAYKGVVHPDPVSDSRFHTLEQRVPTPYSGRAADVVMATVNQARPLLWQTITATPPYRRFYLYLSPPAEKRMPQWLSIYSTLFWLGSLTRYQPVELFDVLDGRLGPFFREFLETQPKQLLYILASDAKQQDVTRAAIV